MFLKNFIEITVNSKKEVHFIQFVTRQYPSIKEYNKSDGKVVKWMGEPAYYMTDPQTPKWKLDISEGAPQNTPKFLINYYPKANKTIFYDEVNNSKKAGSMIDEPSIPMEEERFIACTFITEANKVKYLVKWSLQYIGENKKDKKIEYFAQIENKNYFSHWAWQLLNNNKYKKLLENSKCDFKETQPFLKKILI